MNPKQKPQVYNILIFTLFSLIIIPMIIPWSIALKYHIEKTSTVRSRIELKITTFFRLFGFCFFLNKDQFSIRFLLAGYLLKPINGSRKRKKRVITPGSNNEYRDSYDAKKSYKSTNNHQNGNNEDSLIRKNSEKRNQSIWERLSLFKSPIIKFLRAVPRILSFRQIEITGCWGLNNPMLTGIFYGFQQALSSFPIDSFKIKITPSFHPMSSHINLNFQLRLYLFLFAFFAIRFTIHLLYLRLLNKFGSEGINSGKAVK